MSISFFEADDKVTQSKPFVDAYVNETKDIGSEYAVESIKLTRSGKGYYCETSEFAFMLWKEASLTKQVLEALNVYVSDQHGYELVAVTTDKAPYFKLGVNFEKRTNWFLTQGKYHTSEKIGSSSALQGSNPFLPPTQSNGKPPSRTTSPRSSKNAERGA